MFCIPTERNDCKTPRSSQYSHGATQLLTIYDMHDAMVCTRAGAVSGPEPEPEPGTASVTRFISSFTNVTELNPKTSTRYAVPKFSYKR